MLGQHWQMAQAADPKQLKEKLKYWLQHTIGKHECMTSAGYDQHSNNQHSIILIPKCLTKQQCYPGK